ncbi:MAG: DUF2339 domain-containing protein [Planctomycetes bacterium]|nr:DUF2339 domain-containing protein [Planctomycetota bacterium]
MSEDAETETPEAAQEQAMEPAQTRISSGDTDMNPLKESSANHPDGVSKRVPTDVRSAADWEALIGGNWLNKLGALLLMIGLALFLGYSFVHIGRLGRVAIGFAVSAGLLVLGILFEQRQGYETFARGLIGAGWSGLYFTTYAMHTFVNPPIVPSRMAAMCMLLVVAVGMIVHSLRYRSEALTGLAYFITFATVAISPMSAFTVIALLPLTASLLYIAQRFSWFSMAVFGTVATYGTYALRYYSTGSSETFFGHPGTGQSVLAMYWLLFEAFDLIRTWKRSQDNGPAAAIFPLNALGFIGLSVWQWWPGNADIFFQLCAFTAAAYLASAVIRAAIRPAARFSS